MIRHLFLARGVLALGLVASVASLDAGGQSRPSELRTAWGDPDLQGTWTGATITPLERPERYAGKPVLTVEEAQALEARARTQNVTERAAAAGDPGTYNQVWFDPSSAVVPDRRTSLIVDPPDGRIPFTPAGKAHQSQSSARYGVGARDSHLDLDTGERCLTDGVPIPYWSGYNNNFQIVQTRDAVVIIAEMFRDRRIIPLDGRPRTDIPQWLGESRGRWEGNTLVVETVNFADKGSYWWATSWRAARPTLRMVERFTRVDAETIDYQFTIEDPKMFTRPWTAKFPLTTNQKARGVTQGPLYEYACHEGNHSIVNVLSGARAQEALAKPAKSGSK
ncbi:MAG: hypothetical protein GEU82_09330 [Luteitalea sp.]|nr:hypothetical protein [Luteitalea sp.]